MFRRVNQPPPKSPSTTTSSSLSEQKSCLPPGHSTSHIPPNRKELSYVPRPDCRLTVCVELTTL